MNSLINFIKDSYSEFRYKVEWPKWADLQSYTIVVAIGTVLLSLFTFGVDSLFSTAIKNILALFIGFFN